MRRTLLALSTVLALTVTATSGQQAPPPFLPNGALPVLDAYLESLRLQLRIPGMSAAVIHDGRIAWEKGYGFQNVAARIPATPDTPYLIGDLSGTLAAVLLLQCVEERRIHLDEPVRQYGVMTSEPEVTTRQLMSHTFGEGPLEPFVYSAERYSQLTALAEWCVPQPYRKTVAHRLVNRMAMQDSAPGTDWQDPAVEFPEEIWDPAEVARYRRNVSRLAIPYRVDNRGRIEQTLVPPMGISAAQGFVSTVRDIWRLDAALDSTTTPLLLEDTREHAWTPTVGRRGTPVPMGLGWFVQTHRNERVVWHFGQVPNAYSSLIIKLPAKKTTFILLANSDGLSAAYQLQNGDVTRSLFATVFLRLFT